MLGKDVEMEPVITASRGQIEIPSVRPLDIVRGYRVTFDLKPTDESCEGFYYHCLDMQTGQRMQDAELSTSDAGQAVFGRHGHCVGPTPAQTETHSPK